MQPQAASRCMNVENRQWSGGTHVDPASQNPLVVEDSFVERRRVEQFHRCRHLATRECHQAVVETQKTELLIITHPWIDIVEVLTPVFDGGAVRTPPEGGQHRRRSAESGAPSAFARTSTRGVVAISPPKILRRPALRLRIRIIKLISLSTAQERVPAFPWTQSLVDF